MGDYLSITGSGGVDENYKFKYENGTLSINKAELTVTSNNASREYGNANPTFTGTITGFKTIKPHYGNRQRFDNRPVLRLPQLQSRVLLITYLG